MLCGIPRCNVYLHQFSFEKRARTGREILQPRADGDQEIRAGSGLVGCTGACHADAAECLWMLPGQRSLAGLSFHDGYSRIERERGERRLRTRVQHAAAGDDEWIPRLADRFHQRAQLRGVWARSPLRQRRGLKNSPG